ncbi:MAG: FHIPEP family type III secretion protein, partial [bacterium]
QKKLVSDIIPSQITIGALQKILQNLLEEKISIRDLPTILEAIAEATKFTKSSKNITEHVRGRLGRQITYQHTINEELPIVTLSPEWEKDFSESLVGDGDDKQLSLAPSKLQKFVVSLNKALERNAIN